MMQNSTNQIILQSSDFITTIALYADNNSLCALRSTCRNYKNAFNIIIKKYLDKYYSELIYFVYCGECHLCTKDDIPTERDLRYHSGPFSHPFIFAYQRRDFYNNHSINDPAYKSYLGL
jgi:hypothetical protein